MSKKIKALYTLSGDGIIYISKGVEYDLGKEGGENFIVDNTGKKMVLSTETLRERFE